MLHQSEEFVAIKRKRILEFLQQIASATKSRGFLGSSNAIAQEIGVHSNTLTQLRKLGITKTFFSGTTGMPTGICYLRETPPDEALVDEILSSERAYVRARDRKRRRAKVHKIVRRTRRQILAHEGDPVKEPTNHDLLLNVLQELRAMNKHLDRMVQLWEGGH